MAIQTGFKKFKKYITDASGNHKLVSNWTSSETVELNNGLTLEESEKTFDTMDDYNAAKTAGQIKAGVKYFIKEGGSSSGGGSAKIQVLEYATYMANKSTYDADGNLYMINGGGDAVSAEDMPYDNTDSGISATNVQDAIDTVNENLTNFTSVTRGTATSLCGGTCDWVKCGKICQVNLKGTATASANATIFSGLPEPELGSSFYQIIGDSSTSMSLKRYCIRPEGTIESIQALSDFTQRASFTYICK